MNQTEDLLQELIEQLENGEPVDDVAADLPAEEAEVIRLIAALKQAPAPAVDEALIAAQEVQLLTAVYTQYPANISATVAKPPLTAVLLTYLQQMWTILNNNRLLGDILPTEGGFKWIIRPRGQGLLVFNDGGTITDASDDQYKVVTTFEGSGGLPVLDVLSVAEDLDGEIWVGTGKGIAVFYNADAIFTNGNWDAQQILIVQDGNVQILLATEAVSAILVDGANRKWMGTQSSGVFLVSADGTEQIHHFTAENSPLPSNTIISMTMDELTGEVFFGTDKGIMSYRSDAPEGGTTAECASVFPNPVREDHTGPIAITGLVRDSDVRITDIGGNIVYSTTSLGGQAIWPGTNYNGERVSTGVYMVFSVDAATGTAKCSTKVLVIR